jgi:hypothetical protein
VPGPPAGGADEEIRDAAPAVDPLRILLVEDNVDVRESLKSRLDAHLTKPVTLRSVLRLLAGLTAPR